MKISVEDNDDPFVCITHRRLCPCQVPNEYHLVSNWPSDVEKILDMRKEPRYYHHN